MKALHIECLGIPGAGKTTIAKALVVQLKATDCRLTGNASLHQATRFGKLTRKLAILLAGVLRLKTTTNFWRLTHPLPRKERFRFFSLLITQHYDQTKQTNRLYDQGIYNYLITAVATGQLSLATARLLRDACKHQALLPNQIILVTTDYQIAQTRLFDRSQPHRLRAVSSAEQIAFYRAYDEALGQLLLPDTSIYRLDGTQSPALEVTSILSKLMG